MFYPSNPVNLLLGMNKKEKIQGTIKIQSAKTLYGITHNKIIANLAWRLRRDSLMCSLKIIAQYFQVKGLSWHPLDANRLGKKISMIL